MEIKGVTLEEEGIALFPDAPTLRGVKHVNELIKAFVEVNKKYENTKLLLICSYERYSFKYRCS